MNVSKDDSASDGESGSDEELTGASDNEEGLDVNMNEDGLTEEDIAAAQVSVTLKRARSDVCIWCFIMCYILLFSFL